jgi:hypothetical protein
MSRLPGRMEPAKISDSGTLSLSSVLFFFFFLSLFCFVLCGGKLERRGAGRCRAATGRHGLWPMGHGLRPIGAEQSRARGLRGYDRSRSIVPFFFGRFPFFQSRKKLGVGVSRFVLDGFKGVFWLVASQATQQLILGPV